MARYRLSTSAKSDIAAILRRSGQLHGARARIRYRALLTAALRRIAVDPRGPLTANRTELAADVRSLHIRHCRKESSEAPVASPVHVIFYRVLRPIQILRVLHERMDPSRHIGAEGEFK